MLLPSGDIQFLAAAEYRCSVAAAGDGAAAGSV